MRYARAMAETLQEKIADAVCSALASREGWTGAQHVANRAAVLAAVADVMPAAKPKAETSRPKPKPSKPAAPASGSAFGRFDPPEGD